MPTFAAWLYDVLLGYGHLTAAFFRQESLMRFNLTWFGALFRMYTRAVIHDTVMLVKYNQPWEDCSERFAELEDILHSTMRNYRVLFNLGRALKLVGMAHCIQTGMEETMTKP